MTITSSRPEWAEVSRSALSLELWAIGQEYLEEAALWHDQPGWRTVLRAAHQLAYAADRVALQSSYVTQADAYLTAARMMLPKIQTTRERHTLGDGIYTAEASA
jgi:hypothetical protein